MRFRILLVLIAASAVGAGAYHASRPRTFVMRPDAPIGKDGTDAGREGTGGDARVPAAALPAREKPSGTPVPKAEPVAAMPMPRSGVPKRPVPESPVPSVPAPVPDIPIVMSSVVVVRCSFENAATGGAITAFGSGAIVDPRGYILTARHVIDMDYAYRRSGGRQGFSGYALKSCAVGGPDEGAHAPTPAEIRALNPFAQVGSLPYRADVAFVPNVAALPGMSAAESDFLDMALMKIAGVTDDAGEFFGRSMPASFPTSPLGMGDLPDSGEEILTFGFPSGTPSYGSSFYLQGSVGAVRDYVGGDALFAGDPIGILADMETIGGRSGSPVFSRGRVIGVVSAKQEGSVHATIISTYPLAELLAGSGIALPGL